MDDSERCGRGLTPFLQRKAIIGLISATLLAPGLGFAAGNTSTSVNKANENVEVASKRDRKRKRRDRGSGDSESREERRRAREERNSRAGEDRQKERERRQAERAAERESRRNAERERQRSAERESRQAERAAERERERNAERERKRSAERERRQAEREVEQRRQRKAERERQRNVDRERKRSAERERRQAEREAEQRRQRKAERERQRNADRERKRSAERERRQAEREAEERRQRKAERERRKNAERERNRGAERERRQVEREAEKRRQRKAERERRKKAERERNRGAERERRQAERRRQQRIEKERQQEEERRRNRQARKHREERREQARRNRIDRENRRDRRRVREERQRRRDRWAYRGERLRRWERRLRREHRREIRERRRWERRMRRLIDEIYNPVYPEWPIDTVIVIPNPRPDFPDDHYWDLDEILRIAGSIDQMAFELYQLAKDELKARTPWNDEALSAIYDLVEASHLYEKALVDHQSIEETVYELLYLEETFIKARKFVSCGPLSRKIKENFKLVEYYIEKLLWNYSVNDFGINGHQGSESTGTPALPIFNVIDTFHHGSQGSQTVRDVMACQIYGFKWSKPHDEVVWSVAKSFGSVMAEELVMTSVNTKGRRGKNGVAGIEILEVTYQDGTVEDLIDQAYRVGDSHFSHKTGGLVLRQEGDQVVLKLMPKRPISSVFIKADSWISPDQKAELKLELKKVRKPLPLNRL